MISINNHLFIPRDCFSHSEINNHDTYGKSLTIFYKGYNNYSITISTNSINQIDVLDKIKSRLEQVDDNAIKLTGMRIINQA